MGKKLLYFLSANEDKVALELIAENKASGVEKTICLVQNAVFFGVKSEALAAEAMKSGAKIIACKEDVEVRGLTSLLLDGVEVVDHAGLVAAFFNHDSVINL